ncbi:putative phosphoglycerate mutase [Labrenzia sp. EL_159]|nr:putative phosphoglycerate mutase [Labrenzia sp. EL_162]MBG6192781.1 putative phosphoglycerate mutase [Labrenzia sp. EL_159]
MTTLQTGGAPVRLPQIHDPDLLIFVRHGQTEWNREGRMQGHLDIPLNGTGREQAASNGVRLRDFMKREGFDPTAFDFVASPLGRTRNTMELLRDGMGLGVDGYRLEERLLELTFGEWEGFRLEDLADKEQELLLQRRADKWRFVPPGGESYEMLADRVGDWLKSVLQPTVVVAHGGVFRVLRGWLEGLESANVPKLDVPQDKVFVWRNGQFSAI